MNPKIGRIVLLLILTLGIGLAFWQREVLTTFIQHFNAEQTGAAWLFIGFYALATVLFIPGSLITLAGGALFGPLWGTAFNLIGATTGAVFAFLIARYLAGEYVARRAEGKLKRIIEGVQTEGWRFVLFTRLVPLFPFNLLNYVLGLAPIRFLEYFLATLFGMLPGALAYTYLGYAGKEALTGGQDLIQKSLLALALLAIVAFLPRFIKQLRTVPFSSLELDELKHRLLNDELILMDVRDTADFQAGHIAGAFNIPLPELNQRLTELESYRQQPLAIICHTDRRSKQAIEYLQQIGFAHVLLVKGGMKQWQNQNYPLYK